jgi:hypothetical protein
MGVQEEKLLWLCIAADACMFKLCRVPCWFELSDGFCVPPFCAMLCWAGLSSQDAPGRSCCPGCCVRPAGW